MKIKIKKFYGDVETGSFGKRYRIMIYFVFNANTFSMKSVFIEL